MTLDTVSVCVENKMISPDCDCDGAGADGAELTEEGDGTGEGYARYEFSEEGDNAHIARNVVRIHPS